MPTESLGNLDAALGYLQRGWLPIPLCWPSPDGSCGCGRGHTGKEVGKAPLLGQGYQEIKSTEADLREWWTKWPEANVGILLEPSDLFVIDCDSKEAWREAGRKGGTTPHPTSSTGKGVHLYFRANGYAGRTTKQGDSHAIDILSKGYVVAPPSIHALGKPYEWMLSPDKCGLPEPPAWAVAALSKGSRPLAMTTAGEDEPPVRLREAGLLLWHGDHVVDKADGATKLAGEATEVDRSATLFAIGRELATAGATSSTVTAALRDRDQTLGYYKYSDRNDGGDTEYERIAEKVVDSLTRPFTYTKGACKVRLEKVEFTSLATDGVSAGLESLPMLGQDGYFIKGWAHILAAYPKVGKTELLFACTKEWCTEGQKVLWLSEEGEQVWRHRRVRQADFPEGLRLVFGLGHKERDLLEEAVSGTEDVVIVDTVRSLLNIRDENDNSVVAATLGRWTAALRPKTQIYVHHERKAGGEGGRAIAGGSGFLGIVDRSVELSQDGQAERRRTVFVSSRIVEPPNLLYEMTPEGELMALGSPNDVSLAETKRRVLTVMDGDLKALSAICNALPEPQPSSSQVRKALGELASEGVIERDPREDRRGTTYRWRIKPSLHEETIDAK